MAHRKHHGWECSYQSDRLTGKAERHRAKQDMRNGREPLPEYHTGRYWDD